MKFDQVSSQNFKLIDCKIIDPEISLVSAEWRAESWTTKLSLIQNPQTRLTRLVRLRKDAIEKYVFTIY